MSLTPRPSPRRWAGPAALLVLNGLLLAVALIQHATPAAEAQGGTPRARGEYTLVSGRINAGGADVVSILDAANQELIFLRWDQGKQQLYPIAYRNLIADEAADPGR